MSFAFWPSYWTALLFWTEVSLGCLMVALLQFLTGGRWGLAALPFLRAGIAALGPLLVGFIPLPLGLAAIFPWTAGMPPELAARAHWLNAPAFLIRTVLYLAAFGAAALLVLRWKKAEAPAWAGPLLVGVALVLSLASTDWMMSLDPGIASSLFPFLFASGAFVAVFSGLAFLMSRAGVEPGLLADFGKLLFASLCFWGYIQLGHLLIVWTGNLPREASWYLARVEHGWKPFTVALFFLHFGIPFFLLLSRPLKEAPRFLGAVAVGVFLIHYLELFWMTAPRHGSPLRFDPFDPLLFVGIGWAWIHFFRRHLRKETP